MAGNIKKVFPMLDFVLVQRASRELVSKGGIVLTEKQVKKATEGTVLALGPGSRNPQNGEFIPIELNAGDRVLLPEYGGSRVEVNGEKDEEYLLFHETEILAKIIEKK